MNKARRAPASGKSAPRTSQSAPAAALSNAQAARDLEPTVGDDSDWWQQYTEDSSKDTPSNPFADFFTSDEWLNSSHDEINGPSPEEDGPVVDGPGSDEDVEVIEDVIDAVEEQEELAPPEGIHRPEFISEGQFGALLTKDADIDIKNGPGADASVSRTIPNGTPCQVVATDSGYIEVEFRADGQLARGWVASGIFSDQPRLFKDEDNPELQQDYTWTHTGNDESTDDLAGTDVQQGYLADCYFIAGMNAVGNANADFLEQSVVYDPSTAMYKVRFYEPDGFDYNTYQQKTKEVWVEVDGYLPTEGDSTQGAYARAADGKDQWGAIIEKAYAVHTGGYDVMGNGGRGSEAMELLTGNPAQFRRTSQLSEDQVIPFFEKAEAEGLAIYTGSNASMAFDVQTPLTGQDGHYSGTVTQSHRWNHMMPGTVEISDLSGQVGTARDTGGRDDKKGGFRGADVAGGEVEYHANTIEIDYVEGKAPESAESLQVAGEFQGMLDSAKQVIAWHGYSFDKIVDGGLIQLYNPWGSWQPKPLTPAEYLKYYSTLSTCQVPQAQGAE